MPHIMYAVFNYSVIKVTTNNDIHWLGLHPLAKHPVSRALNETPCDAAIFMRREIRTYQSLESRPLATRPYISG